MKQFGRVTALRPDNLALVSMSAAESCSNCSTRHVCQGLSLTGKKRCREVLVPNHLDAGIGDSVELELRPAATIAAITSTFLLPVLGLVAGYVVGAPGGLAHAAIGTGTGLVIGIVLSILINRGLARKPGFQLQMTRIVEAKKDDSSAPDVQESPADGEAGHSVPGGQL